MNTLEEIEHYENMRNKIRMHLLMGETVEAFPTTRNITGFRNLKQWEYISMVDELDDYTKMLKSPVHKSVSDNGVLIYWTV